jgi:hypothetical protein
MAGPRAGLDDVDAASVHWTDSVAGSVMKVASP